MLSYRSQRHRIVIGTICAVAALGVLMDFTGSALAISAPIHIANTGGEGVYIRPEPNTSKPALGWMPEGASPDYHCFAWGQNINGVPIWFNVTYNGVTGFYASYFDDSSYHSNEELTAKYGVPLCGAAPPPPPTPTPAPPASSPAPPSPTPTPPPASGNLMYSIFNAEGGIYFRNSPSWGDTSRIAGVGVYNDDRVQLICGAFGEPYGPYANRWWSYVQNLTRPSAGKGWVNAHFINDGVAANTPSPGETTCGAGTPGAGGMGGVGSGSPPAAHEIKSVFYSPDHNIPASHSAGDLAINVDRWSAVYAQGLDHCMTGLASNPSTVPSTVTTLAGWSYGRLGPMYFLLSAGAERVARIHTIILFDPGSYRNMAEGCEGTLHPRIAVALASWLAADRSHKLIVMAGRDTENRPIVSIDLGKPDFGGLWHFYFPAIWRQSFADRALVCDYDFLDHEKVIEDFAWIVKEPPDKCPISSLAPMPVEWHP